MPVIFEAPYELSQSGFELWIAAAGGINWGGCDVYVSTDNSVFKLQGRITGPARHGVLTAALPTGTAVPGTDSVNTCSVDLSTSRGDLDSGTSTDLDNLVTLCYVGGEFIAYETATLTAAHKYDLTILKRGAYGSPIASPAAIGTKFARCDAALFKFPFLPSMIGQTIYFKFLSFNTFGKNEQDIASVSSISHVIGTPLGVPGAPLTVPAGTGFLHVTGGVLDPPTAIAESDVAGLVSDLLSIATDLAAKVEIGGQLGGTETSPEVVGITEATGPTPLSIAGIADGEYLKRSGSTIVSGTPAGGGSTGTPAAAATLVQSVGPSGLASGGSISLGSAPTNGNFLILHTATIQFIINSIVQTGVTWKKVRADRLASGNFSQSEVWIGVVGAGASASITVNYNGNSTQNVWVAEFSGVTKVDTWTGYANTAAFQADGLSIPNIAAGGGTFLAFAMNRVGALTLLPSGFWTSLPGYPAAPGGVQMAAGYHDAGLGACLATSGGTDNFAMQVVHLGA